MDAKSHPSWGVDSYQVPVPNGDCSFHFLVRRDMDKQAVTIHKAIIVDGGQPKTDAREAIEDTIKNVTKIYKDFLGFDYWLVTHWDTDHYAGALEYLSKGTKKPRVFGPVAWNNNDLGASTEDLPKLRECLGGGEEGLNEIYEVGQDFFSETLKLFPRPKSGNFQAWLQDLVHGNTGDKADMERPMFLCIGANGYCFNKDMPVDNDITTEKNRTSAFFVIAWPGSKNVCYYAAGDGNEKIEESFRAEGFFKADATLVMKGTHHGAFNAFDPQFFEQMKPQNYVVSAGKEYGHPTAALLVFFAYYKQSQSDNDAFTLYTSRYPYWLYGDPAEHGNSFLNVEHIKTVFKKNIPANQELTNQALKNIQKLVNGPDVSTNLTTLLEHLKEIWTFLSGSKPPTEDDLQDKPYRVRMRFFHAAMGKSLVIVSVGGSEEKEQWIGD